MVVIFSNMLMPQSGILIPGSLGVARYFKLIVGGCAAWLLAHAKQLSAVANQTHLPLRAPTMPPSLAETLNPVETTGYELLLYPAKHVCLSQM